MGAQRFSVDDLAALTPLWDAAVDRTPDVDQFCASSTWSFSAALSFQDAEPPVIVGDGMAFCGMRRAVTTDGQHILVGLDPIWGFATPFVGNAMQAGEMAALRLSLDDDIDLAVVAGQREDSVLTAGLIRALDNRRPLYRGPVEQRLQVDLRDGVDVWFARRSPRFRQRLRRLEHDADRRGLEVEDVSAAPPDELIDRLVSIESRTWKGEEGTGLASTELVGFYRQMTARLAVRDHARALVARLDDRDVGFLLGGVRGETFRGLQLGYTSEVADLGVGHLLQLEQIRRSAGEGIVTYDLGMDMEYKRRWADRVEETFSVIVGR